MEDNTYIKYTRSLHNNPKFKSLSFEYRHIFITILVNMAFKPVEMNDHGVIINLQAGQFMTTIRGLVKLCDEPSIDKSKVERALKMFENVGFSRQETRHRKTIVTVTESSICDSLKIENETRIDTKSRQDRDIKEEVKEIKEKETHTDVVKVVGGCDINFKSFNPPSFKNSDYPESSEKSDTPLNDKKIELRQTFGDEELVELTYDQHRKLLKSMTEEEFSYWVRQIEIEIGRKGIREFNQKNKSHYHAILAFKEYRESNSTSPFSNKNISKCKKFPEENLKYARQAEKLLKSPIYQLHALSQHVEIVPSNGSSKIDSISYSENGFKEQFDNLLRKRGFRKI